MKKIRLVALSALVTVGAFSGVLYTSCTKDACKGVTCLNSGTCDGGTCTCPSGIGGNTCETVYRSLYNNNYVGNGTDNDGYTYTNWKLAYSAGTDTSDYTKMSLFIYDNTNTLAIPKQLPVVLTNFGTSSTYNITSTVNDTNTYSGTGTISATAASISLTEAHPHSTALILTFTNAIKQ